MVAEQIQDNLLLRHSMVVYICLHFVISSAVDTIVKPFFKQPSYASKKGSVSNRFRLNRIRTPILSIFGSKFKGY